LNIARKETNNMKFEKVKVDFVFVILVYRNFVDLKECIISIKKRVKNFDIIIVNAFFDKESEKQIKDIADYYSCRFISIENKGYSFGNNVGIRYAYDKYDFKYVIISNPDVVIQSFGDNVKKCTADIIAPLIITPSGKYQNPMIAQKCSLSELLIYIGFKRNNKFLFLLGVFINRVLREINLLVMNILSYDSMAIYAAHGSFVILSKYLIEKMELNVYDNNIFLFSEENVLAEKATALGAKTVYLPSVRILHKEDGSMNLSNFSVNNELTKSNIYVYENYLKKKFRSKEK
jgi:Predicted glycosyltransferases